MISGPVWEYYSGNDWKLGLEHELKEDKLCGFIGKTVIHPNQIPIVNLAYQVSQMDYEDAKAILNWDKKNPSFVSGSLSNERMNEYKTHTNWG
ncbi:putative ATP/GTP-binding protein [Lachnospiraceae bacterium TWA4]|nr:putative ATP/GTP-binding protein [Lachnospiraceae bacterium TWA4]